MNMTAEKPTVCVGGVSAGLLRGGGVGVNITEIARDLTDRPTPLACFRVLGKDVYIQGEDACDE